MKVAIAGGTHGNEPVGVEVIRAFKALKPNVFKENEYSTFFANPRAYEEGRRFVDSDLNRAFGKASNPSGYERIRAKELRDQIQNKFDLTIDLHTTTTNMGFTAILNNTNSLSRKVCSFLKTKHPELKIIEEDVLDEESTHLDGLTNAGVTLEFGPVANNVVSGSLVLKMYEMVLDILNWDFKIDFDFTKEEIFKVKDIIYFPKEDLSIKEAWYIHPSLENQDFKPLKAGDPIFINLNGDTKNYEGSQTVYPFFINEAAYLKDNSAMVISVKKQLA